MNEQYDSHDISKPSQSGSSHPNESLPPNGLPAAPPSDHVVTRTGASEILVALSAFFVVLLLIVIFIIQNMSPVKVSFLWMQGSLPLALAMLLSVISGALLMALAAGARVLQLRHTASRHRNDDILKGL